MLRQRVITALVLAGAFIAILATRAVSGSVLIVCLIASAGAGNGLHWWERAQSCCDWPTLC